MVAADREEVAIAAEDKDMQVRAREGDSAGKGQGTSVDVMRAIALDKVGESTGAADAGDGGDLLLPQFPALDEFEIEGQDREIAAARTPGRVVGGNFLFGERLAFLGRLWGRGKGGAHGG